MNTTTTEAQILAAKYVLRIKAFAANRTFMEITSFQQEEKDRLNDTAERLGVEQEDVDFYIEDFLPYSIEALSKMLRSRKFNEE